MSLLSKAAVVAIAVLGIRALKNKRSAKAPVAGTPARKPAKALRSPQKLVAAARSTAAESDGGRAAPKPRSRKRPGRRRNAKHARH